MIRASRLTSADDFALEARREAIRNSRWRRHRSMILSAALAVAMVGVSDDLTSHLVALLKALV